MSVKLKHLHYAEMAARHDSFRKAADVLGLTQSNLSAVQVEKRIRSPWKTARPGSPLGR
ncbi:helix-turn-helix domain-containing protein [Bradyrhizobium sp. AZCC 1610]|uniref:helix-turn-helix domain-containing protein n=1 Tax=Bradyrhizobium sp. AZCC 1610 TaxID=3117020 RepID=UPI002FF401B1